MRKKLMQISHRHLVCSIGRTKTMMGTIPITGSCFPQLKIHIFSIPRMYLLFSHFSNFTYIISPGWNNFSHLPTFPKSIHPSKLMSSLLLAKEPVPISPTHSKGQGGIWDFGFWMGGHQSSHSLAVVGVLSRHLG